MNNSEWAAIDNAWNQIKDSATSNEPRMSYLTNEECGDYQAKIYRLEVVNRNQSPTIRWVFQVISGDYKNYFASHTTWLDAEDPKSMARAARDFASVGHAGSPSSFAQNVGRYVDAIVNIQVRPNTKNPKFPWVYIEGVAKEAAPSGVPKLPGMPFVNKPAEAEKFNDEDIPF